MRICTFSLFLLGFRPYYGLCDILEGIFHYNMTFYRPNN